MNSAFCVSFCCAYIALIFLAADCIGKSPTIRRHLFIVLFNKLVCVISSVLFRPYFSTARSKETRWLYGWRNLFQSGGHKCTSKNV